VVLLNNGSQSYLGNGAMFMLLAKACQQKLQYHITGCYNLTDIWPIHCKKKYKQGNIQFDSTNHQLQQQIAHSEIQMTTRNVANAQRDGRPAEHRWRPLFDATKSGWCSLLYCCAVTLPRHKGRWYLEGCHNLVNRSQPLVGRVSSPYCGDMWRTYCCLTTFFRLSIGAFVAKI